MTTLRPRPRRSSRLPPAERTLPAMLLRGAERHGERPLLSFGDATWSHARCRGSPRRGPRRCAPPASAAATGWR